MHNHRVNELLELLKPYWLKEPTLSLTQTFQKIAAEAGSEAPLAELGDEVIIYQLKMSTQDKLAPIPGLQKDYEEDFKSALLKARGVVRIKGSMFCRLPANTAKQLVSHRFASDKLAARYETSCFAIGICTAVRAKVGEAA